MRYRDVEKRLADLEAQQPAQAVVTPGGEQAPWTEAEMWAWATAELQKYVADRGVNLGALSPEGKRNTWNWACERHATMEMFGYCRDDADALNIVRVIDEKVAEFGEDVVRQHLYAGPVFDTYLQARAFLIFDGVHTSADRDQMMETNE